MVYALRITDPARCLPWNMARLEKPALIFAFGDRGGVGPSHNSPRSLNGYPAVWVCTKLRGLVAYPVCLVWSACAVVRRFFMRSRWADGGWLARSDLAILFDASADNVDRAARQLLMAARDA